MAEMPFTKSFSLLTSIKYVLFHGLYGLDLVAIFLSTFFPLYLPRRTLIPITKITHRPFPKFVSGADGERGGLPNGK